MKSPVVESLIDHDAAERDTKRSPVEDVARGGFRGLGYVVCADMVFDSTQLTECSQRARVLPSVSWRERLKHCVEGLIENIPFATKIISVSKDRTPYSYS